ncbi:MAG: DNA-binding domain-containing protein [Clostridia bacterium]|nr:DNA-binding domain-containing protein [Clostridia bacterium]
MKYYILDDDLNVVKMLRNIIENDFNRRVIGFGTDPAKAVDEIVILKPDILLVDYLMPTLDGADVIERVKGMFREIEVIMISQVSDKAMIATAYQQGVNVFISKPLNHIEIGAVLSHVEEKIETGRKLNQIVSLIGAPSSKSMTNQLGIIRSILKDLGIYSEKGSKDILSIMEIVVNRNCHLEEGINAYCCQVGEKEKSVRQRMRRASMRGLRNLAYLGIEDYTSDNFVKYCSSLYDFESVKKEMDYIRGAGMVKGSVTLDRFLENLIEF